MVDDKSLSKKRSFAMKDFFDRILDIPKNFSDTENKTRMIVSLVPFLEKALFFNKDREEIEKIWNYVYDLKYQMDKLHKEKINYEFMKTEEFYNLLKKVVQQIKLEYKDEKIKLFRNFILNSIRTDKTKIDFHYFLNKIINLELEHFEILEWYLKNDFVRSRSIGSEYDQKKIDELSQISKYYGALEIDLNNHGFLSLIQVEPNSKRYLLTRLGQEFLSFIWYDEVSLN